MEEEKSLHKWVPDLKTQEQLHDALEKAFEYRGDITITLKDGSQLTGYIFNHNADALKPFIEVLPPDKEEKVRIAYDDVAGLNFSGTDPAAGKSWSAYLVSRYRNR
jgi:hypothetical protein